MVYKQILSSQFQHSVKTTESEKTFVKKQIKMKFSNNDIIKRFKASFSNAVNVGEALSYIKLSCSIRDDIIDDLKRKISQLEVNFKRHWRDCHYTRERFNKHHEKWLNNEFKIDEYLAPESSKSSEAPSTSKRARQEEPSEESAEGSKKRAIAEEPSNHMFIQLSKDEPARIEECAALFLDTDSNVYQWKAFSEFKCNKMPCYETLLEEGIKPCCPEDQHLHVDDTKVKMDLQALVNHTAKRIVKIKEKEIVEYLDSTGKLTENLILLSSWGLDGSSAYSQYYHSTSDPDNTDILATVTTPLRLSAASEPSKIHWRNLMPQSIRFCRPIEFEFIRDTNEVRLEKKREMEAEMRNLEPVKVDLPNGKFVSIDFDFIRCQSDENTADTETSPTQCCSICGATPTEMTNWNAEAFTPKQGIKEITFSPLRAWMEFLECLLHITYRLQFKKWQVTKHYKDQYETRKAEIHQQMWEKLKVDLKRAHGTGTTGNACRKAFSNPKELSQILEIDEELIVMFRNILIAITCQQSMEPKLFKDFCTQAYQRYLELYSWFKMPAAVHKVLAHGAEILTNSPPVPLGVFREPVKEENIKEFYKRHRELNSKKCSRQANMKDVFIRVMKISDPLVSSCSLEKRREHEVFLELPIEVKNLLLFREVANTTSRPIVEDEDDEEIIDLENEIMEDLAEIDDDWTEDVNLALSDN